MTHYLDNCSNSRANTCTKPRLFGRGALIRYKRYDKGKEFTMSRKKILMIVGDYVEDYEVMVPFQALLMVGHTVHAVCPDKKAGEKVRTAIHDFEGTRPTVKSPATTFR